MSTVAAKIRCRNNKCTKREEDGTIFINCSKCQAARYCSQACLDVDAPLHTLMCKTDRVLLDNDGNVTSLAEGLAKMDIEVKEMVEEKNKSNNNTNTMGPQGTTSDPQDRSDQVEKETIYLDPLRYNDEHVMRETIHRLQIQTNLFYVDQLEKLMISLGKKAKATKPAPKKQLVSKKKPATQIGGKKNNNNNDKKTPTAVKKAPTNNDQVTVKDAAQTTTQDNTAPSTADTTTPSIITTETTLAPTDNTNVITVQPPPQPQQIITIPKPNVFLFLQTENDLSEYRWLVTTNNPLNSSSPQPPSKLDRSLVCYFMTYDEFTQEVLPNHPHPSLKTKNLKQTLLKLMQQNNPQTGVITLCLFGMDKMYLNGSELPPYDTMIGQLEENNQFVGADCLEINIDQ